MLKGTLCIFAIGLRLHAKMQLNRRTCMHACIRSNTMLASSAFLIHSFSLAPTAKCGSLELCFQTGFAVGPKSCRGNRDVFH